MLRKSRGGGKGTPRKPASSRRGGTKSTSRGGGSTGARTNVSRRGGTSGGKSATPRRPKSKYDPF